MACRARYSLNRFLSFSRHRCHEDTGRMSWEARRSAKGTITLLSSHNSLPINPFLRRLGRLQVGGFPVLHRYSSCRPGVCRRPTVRRTSRLAHLWSTVQRTVVVHRWILVQSVVAPGHRLSSALSRDPSHPSERDLPTIQWRVHRRLQAPWHLAARFLVELPGLRRRLLTAKMGC